MSTSPRSALPSNRYVQRTAVKEGTCFICGYSTATLLVTEQSSTKDWFYVCMIHTFIPDFCTAIDEGVAADTGASETSKTTTSALPSTLQGSNNNAKAQKHSLDKAVDDSKAKVDSSSKEPTDKKSDSNSKNGAAAARSTTASTSSTSETTKSASPKTGKKVYVLHRDYFYLRQRPFIKRWEQGQANQLTQKLPNVPYNSL